MVFAIAMVMALPAAAKKGSIPGPPDDEPTQPCETVTTLSGRGSLGFGCDWTPLESGATGTVTVTEISGDVSRVVVFVRDSAPGDICVLEQWDKATGTVFSAQFDLVVGDQNYWEGATHWCEQFDPIAGPREDLNGKPLHVQVGVRGKRGTVVAVSLSPGQVPAT